MTRAILVRIGSCAVKLRRFYHEYSFGTTFSRAFSDKIAVRTGRQSLAEP